ncbi:NAD(P)H dehydrogenase (quinone) [Caulobacter ginsengisoli]|uniref:NAD(P)H dehydrogenase (Quinone) n=1 Tax=Caulobacter ginsengisoli TaxID=400775 RepID=A0ABU0IVD0_9CAUL|nr:NAD(P)H-dependent oxidoreductase [Caulobacter ginsengisoli]MDQ0465969.1 NAD(P)H dehydrogenase (quinone) [Caulobacter ginsengisoli]
MRHAVILAHPRRASFCGAVARTCAKTLKSMGHSVVTRDLYAIGFDPCLRAEELPTTRGHAPRADVVAERAKLARCDSFIFIYPFWFNAPPAILKGYVDRVFSLGFGYRPALGGTAGLLIGRSLMSVSTSGAPEDWVEATGALGSLEQTFDRHVAAVTGLDVRGHLHLGSVVPGMTKAVGETLLGQVDQALREKFAPLS